jgi:hypothetical protein
MTLHIVDDMRAQLVLYTYGFERFWTQVAIAALLQYELHCENLFSQRKYDAEEYLMRIFGSHKL